LPIHLTAIYPRWRIDDSNWLAYIPVIVLAGSFIAFYWNRKSWGRPFLFGLGYFVAMLFPVLGFVDQNFYQYSLVADHWQYYSIVGVIALMIAGGLWICTRWRESWRYWAGSAFVVLLLLFGWSTWTRTQVYANSEALWRDAIRTNPDAWAAHANLGNTLLPSGNVQEAVHEYQEALKIEPFLAEPHNNLGTILINAGRLQEAIGEYEQALKVKIDYPEAQNNLGSALMIAGRSAEAIPHLRAAVDLNPNYAEARYNLAVLLADQGKVDEAISQLKSAVKVEPERKEFQIKLRALEDLKAGR
jgi:Flp pilus assembly protein TadD